MQHQKNGTWNPAIYFDQGPWWIYLSQKRLKTQCAFLRSILRIGVDNTNLDEPTWQWSHWCPRKSWRSLAPCGHVVVPNLRCIRPSVTFFCGTFLTMKSSVDFSSVSVISTKIDSLVPFQTKLIDTLPLLLHSDIWRSWRPSRQSCRDSIPAPWVRPNHGKSPEDPVDGLLWMVTYAYCACCDSPMYSTTTSKALSIYLKNDWRWLSRVIIYAFFKYGIAVLEPWKHGVWHPGGVLTPIQCTMTSCPTFWGERVRHDKSWRELVAPGTQLFGVFGMGPGIPMDYQSI